MRGARQHAVFCCDPTLTRIFEKWWYTRCHRCGTNDFCVTKLYQHGAFGVFNVVAGDSDITHLVTGTLTWSHDLDTRSKMDLYYMPRSNLVKFSSALIFRK